jgi:hypothetical protein
VRSSFDEKKDYLSLEIRMTADATSVIKPNWKAVRLSHKKDQIKPNTIWAEREIIQKDTAVLARFVFKRPDVPRTLKDVALLIPLDGHKSPIRLPIPARSK